MKSRKAAKEAEQGKVAEQTAEAVEKAVKKAEEIVHQFQDVEHEERDLLLEQDIAWRLINEAASITAVICRMPEVHKSCWTVETRSSVMPWNSDES